MSRRLCAPVRLCLVWLLPLLLLADAGGALAQSPPQVPAARFYGTVAIHGVAAPAGTTVVAQSAGTGSLCGSGVVSDDAGSYFVDVQPYGGCSAGVVFLVNGQRADQTAQFGGASAAIPLNLTVFGPFPPPPFGATLTYAAGWNLVGGPAGTVIAGVAAPLFTLQAGDAGYEVLPAGSAQRAGEGYWVYFLVPTTVALPASGFASLTVPMPYGQLVMIGDPFTAPAVVSGAAAAYTYSPGFGYQVTTVLQPGQGSWALSYSGSITLSAVVR